MEGKLNRWDKLGPRVSQPPLPCPRPRQRCRDVGFFLGWVGRMGSPFTYHMGISTMESSDDPPRAPARDKPLPVSQGLGSLLVCLMGLLSPQ